MRVKKILSGLLAALMIVTAVPFGAMSVPMTVEAVSAGQLKEDTWYRIVSKKSGMAMTVSGFATGNNATIVQWQSENYESQMWKVDYDDNGYYRIINKHSNKLINVPYASTESGITMAQWNLENGDNSKFEITDAGDGYVRITPKLVPDMGLNVEDNSMDRGAEIIQFDYSGSDNSLWMFEEVAEADIQANPDINATIPDARLAIDSYIDKFFYVEDGVGKLRNMPSNGFWTDAEVLEVFIDAYEHLGDKKYLTVAEQFFDGFCARRGTNWKGNGFNDDIMWAVIASIRLYEHTGNEKHLQAARENFDLCYERGWDETFAGGGIWWTTDNQSKNACVNSPGAIAAALIAKQLEEEGNADANAYWEKAVKIWDWEYDVLFFKEEQDGHKAGEIMDTLHIDDSKSVYWANTGNQGVYAGASALLYEKYGDQKYKDVALLALDLAATMGDGEEGYLNREANSGDSIGGKGLLGRWLGLVTEVFPDVTKYDTFMKNNAAAAWFHRNSDNLMWGAFGRPTIENVEDCDEVF